MAIVGWKVFVIRNQRWPPQYISISIEPKGENEYFFSETNQSYMINHLMYPYNIFICQSLQDKCHRKLKKGERVIPCHKPWGYYKLMSSNKIANLRTNQQALLKHKVVNKGFISYISGQTHLYNMTSNRLDGVMACMLRWLR